MISAASCALVADSSPYISALVRDVLVGLRVRRVLEARDGAEALTLLTERKPALVVLDWDLTIVGARDILATVRDGGEAPAIAVTMREPTRSAVEAALGFGVGTILSMPLSTRELRMRLARLATIPGGGAHPESIEIAA